MQLKQFQIDAFASRVFEGNPAAVVPLMQWLSDDLLQAIAQENNLAETAFFVAQDSGYRLRWFTPNKEVKLCGHATLASAFVLYSELGFTADTIEFYSLSGPLTVQRQGELLTLDFPLQAPSPCEVPDALAEGLGVSDFDCFESEDYLVVLDSQAALQALTPDAPVLKQLGRRGVIVTAPSEQYDFVSRFFAPKYAIMEDSVTGSSFTQLGPYWGSRLGKTVMQARQISRRGGDVIVELQAERVLISGSCVKFSEGVIEVPDP